MPGRARDVAMAPDGSRAWVAAGRDVVTVDLATRATAGSTPARGCAARARGLARRRAGVRAPARRDRRARRGRPARGWGRSGCAARPARSRWRPPGCAPRSRAAGASRWSTSRTRRVVRRPRVRGAAGVAFDALGRAWVSAPGRLVALGASSGRPFASAKLGRDGGGGVAIAPDGRRALVAPGRRRRAAAALVDLQRRRVLARPRSGAGPGRAAWSPDGIRAYATASASVAAVSAFTGRVLRRAAIPGGRPAGLAVQPGLALALGTEGPDILTGTRGDDRLLALGGDDVVRGGRGNDQLDGGAGERPPRGRDRPRPDRRRRRRRHGARRSRPRRDRARAGRGHRRRRHEQRRDRRRARATTASTAATPTTC